MDLAETLRDAGGVVAGGSALGAGVTWVAAVIASDLGLPVDVGRCVEYGAGMGAVIGIAALLLRAGEVR